MNIWLVSMECAGLVEAGGVKNVTYSLCKALSQKGNSVTLFIPVFGCSTFENVFGYDDVNVERVFINIGNKQETVEFTTGRLKDTNVKIFFINHPSFAQKQGVYVYTMEEQKMDPQCVCGKGHIDTLFLDALLSKAVCEYGTLISKDQIPDIIHCQDASTAVVPSYINQKRDIFTKTKCVVTIHNAGPAYHHEYQNLDQAIYYTSLPRELLCKAFNGNRVEPFLLASIDGYLSTVSDYYAKELVSENFNNETDGLSGIFNRNNINIMGITNGIDYDRYDPEYTKCSLLPYAYSPITGDLEGKYKNREYLSDLSKNITENLSEDYVSYLENVEQYGTLLNDKNGVYFMFHGRIVWQKGISILIPVIKKILSKYQNVYFLVEGQGDPNYENQMKELSRDFPDRMIYFYGYNRALSRLIAAVADFALFPSFFEPCGLEDFIAQIYGTIPLAHATGGLNKIINGKTGFTYLQNTEEQLTGEIEKLISLKTNNDKSLNTIIKNACQSVKENYSWDFVSEKYLNFFTNILG